jgi:hypothetical protein
LSFVNAELNHFCYLLEFLGAHHILHVSRMRVNCALFGSSKYKIKLYVPFLNCFTLRTEALRFPLTIYQSTRCNSSKDLNLQNISTRKWDVYSVPFYIPQILRTWTLLGSKAGVHNLFLHVLQTTPSIARLSKHRHLLTAATPSMRTHPVSRRDIWATEQIFILVNW